MSTAKHLEREAIRAHAAGEPWATFWPTVAAQVAQAEPIDRSAYHRLVRRLVALLAAGDLDGAQPAGDGWPRPMPWEIDNGEMPGMVPADLET
jgi:hypothetical protein